MGLAPGPLGLQLLLDLLELCLGLAQLVGVAELGDVAAAHFLGGEMAQMTSGLSSVRRILGYRALAISLQGLLSPPFRLP